MPRSDRHLFSEWRNGSSNTTREKEPEVTISSASKSLLDKTTDKRHGDKGSLPNGAPAEARDLLKSYLNHDEDDQMEIQGYRPRVISRLVTWTAILLSFGVLRLVFYWFDEWYLKCTHVRCPLREAQAVLIIEYYQKKHRHVYVRRVQTLTANDIKLGSQNAEAKRLSVGADGSRKKLVYPAADGSFIEVDSIRMFTCKKMRYIWDPTCQEFQRLRIWGTNQPTSAFHPPDEQHQLAGLSAFEQAQRRVVYGTNFIHVPVKSAYELLIREALSPFYIFQIFSVTLWFLIEYFIYASAIVAMSATSIISSVIQTRRNQRKLRSTVHDRDVVTVCRGNNLYESISTEDLVPGDLIVIPKGGCVMHCDAVLLCGTCIVNESMLTGESVPVTKTPLPHRSDVMYNVKEHGRHTLFCGTRIVQTRFFNDEKVIAVVTSTGFMTTKGSLVSAIMYPPPVDFRFERDSYKFIAFLGFLACIGLVYNVYQRLSHGESGAQIFLHSFDLITICVPPALPAAMTAGIILAQKRLKRKRIYCISPRTINVAGTLNCMCFDKTGTLTEDGLDMWGVVPALEGQFLAPLKDPQKLADTIPVDSESTAGLEPLLLIGMAACHSLTRINGTLSGDPLDLKMFESTGCTLTEPSHHDANKFDQICPTVVTYTTVSSSRDIGILRQFPFSSSKQRMAVLCRVLETPHLLHFFCKGSPEVVKSLSLSDTVPLNFDEILEEYTGKGYRVIALAYREIDSQSMNKLQRIQREDLENGLTFLGFAVLENRLKKDTVDVIKQLRDAQIRTIMVTGDNLLTGISVARECGMIPPHDDIVIVDCVENDPSAKPSLEYKVSKGKSIQAEKEVRVDMEENHPQVHYALTGKCWSVLREHYPTELSRIAVRGTVFARMSPDQKQQLVEELQRLGYCVGMCGDGANDCGALKAAFAGISLSETEASVASPFTAQDPSISCVPELIRQGRCALVTSFGIFKFMAAYSITQFVSVMILYDIGSNLTDFEFLYIDVFIVCALCLFFGNNDPHQGPLFHKPPLTSLLSPSPIGSLIIQMSLVGLFQALSLVVLSHQEWFSPFSELNNSTGFLTGNIACHENYSVFCISLFQYIALAVAFAKGRPYRTAVYQNKLFTGIAALVTILSTWILLQPPSFIRHWLELMVPEQLDFRLTLFGLCLVEFAAILLSEAILIDWLLVKFVNSPFWRKVRPFKESYVAILSQMKTDSAIQI